MSTDRHYYSPIVSVGRVGRHGTMNHRVGGGLVTAGSFSLIETVAYLDGYNFITQKVLPRLKELGASEEVIHQIMVENPRQFFEGK